MEAILWYCTRAGGSTVQISQMLRWTPNPQIYFIPTVVRSISNQPTNASLSFDHQLLAVVLRDTGEFVVSDVALAGRIESLTSHICQLRSAIGGWHPIRSWIPIDDIITSLAWHPSRNRTLAIGTRSGRLTIVSFGLHASDDLCFTWDLDFHPITQLRFKSVGLELTGLEMVLVHSDNVTHVRIPGLGVS